MITRSCLPFFLAPLLILASFSKTNAESTDNAFAPLATAFDQEIRPLLDRYCLDCHAGDVKKGELDLERFQSLSEVREAPGTWQHLLEQLETNEMPPSDKRQPTREERESLIGWTRRYLDQEARFREGDPGPVVLRRLNHTEFAYTVRDLTGVQTLDPTKEFPVESAAGEGFTNIGDALVMSPALLEKYLQAAKGIAAHAVLLPEGFRFSPHTTRRDWSDAILNEIRALYHEKLHGAELDFAYQGREVGSVLPAGAADGKLNLEPYFEFLLENRDSLMGSLESADEWARAKNLNSKYASLIAKMLITNSSDPSPLLDRLRRRWRSLQPHESGVLVDEIQRWQSQLWKFNPVGHLGVEQPWQEPVSPLQNERRFRTKIQPPDPQTDVTIRLEAGTAGDSGEFDIVRWKNPRVERAGQPAIPLRDVSAAAAGFSHLRSETIDQLPKLLDLAFAWKPRAPVGESAVVNLASAEGFDVQTLLSLFHYLGMLSSDEVEIQGHLHQRIEQFAGETSVLGWTLPGVADLTFLANASDRTLRIPGEAPPKKIVVHPRPERWVAAAWKSPVTGRIDIAASVADRHPACGNGVRWSLEYQRGNQRQVLQSGANGLGQTATIEPIIDFPIRVGEVISLVIGARDGNHACDLTEIDLNVTMQSDEPAIWSLSTDCATSLAQSNPHPDRYDHPDVWHFYSGPEESAGEAAWQTVPKGSLLSEWARAEDADAAAKIASRLQSFLSEPPSPATPEPDVVLHAQMTQPFGALFARVDFAALAAQARDMGWVSQTEGLPPNRFDATGDLVVRAPSVVSFTLPSAFFSGAEFVVTGILDETFGESGSVQLNVSPGSESQSLTALVPGLPVTVLPGSTAERTFNKAFDSFRDLFPAAMCYARIVPIDEVVTLVLYHREDAHLARLMLTDDERRRLDRLWEELRYVSQDALTIVDALEQIIEFATQDADPSKFYPLREPIAEQAEAFRQQLRNSAPSHLDALVTFAPRVFRRPLTAEETEELRGFYRQLRENDLPHEEAFRLTLARLFTSPSFLYRTETPAPGAEAGPVSSWELATRLSYFLWSSAPDEELHRLASTEALLESDSLLEQTRRMLQDKRVRRLAIEFACQWLHLRDFDQLDEKSERHFPEFVGLRESMYEESIRFFTDLFQNDGAILAILDADHTFVDPALADFYGLGETVSGGWERVSGLRAQGRGGILGMASTLAKQSGASRTSPVLRGAWVSETLLGEKLPKPPAQVPPLPETVPAGLTERQLIERHRADPACANCHARIDPYGLALESFDAIGRLRAIGGDGKPIDSHAELRDGTQFVGIDGLRDYLLTVRVEAFVRQFCKKLLGYALGRSVLLSDEPLLDEMEKNLLRNDYAFGAAIETLVLSQQFREIRGARQH